jgi:cell division protein ZapE
MMSLQLRYTDDLSHKGFTPDPVQQQAIVALQHLSDTLNKQGMASRGVVMRLLMGPIKTPGIYLWGSVGRGKTYLMDIFYESLNGVSKQRVHYHRFMLDIHEQLRVLPKSPNPLMIIGRSISRKTRVLCLDEFHVTDVADAMLLTGLLHALFSHGVTLVVTSNTRLDELYLNGLQRERFMQAIALLKDCTVEIDLQAGQDYRLLHLKRGETYLLANELSQQTLFAKFNELAPGDVLRGQPLVIHDRNINTIAISDDLVWFDFHELCDTPRAAKDYLELARLFHTVFVSNIPQLVDAQDSAAKRFMHLVDALYDHRVKLIASASTQPAELYRGRLLKGAFDRTVSRLIEMGSEDYLGLAHKP